MLPICKPGLQPPGKLVQAQCPEVGTRVACVVVRPNLMLGKYEVKAEFPVCQLLDVLHSETKEPESKTKSTSALCPKL